MIEKHFTDAGKIDEADEEDVASYFAKKSTPFQKIKYEVVVIPFLAHKTIQLMHKDNFLLEEVHFSSFTMNDDVFLMVGRKFYMFDAFGNPLQLKMNHEDICLFKDDKLRIVRICTNYLMEAG